MLAFVCDYLPSRIFEKGRLALGRTKCILNASVHTPDVPGYGGCLYILAELCPILVRTSPRGLLNLAPGSSGLCLGEFPTSLWQSLWAVRHRTLSQKPLQNVT